MSSTYCCNALFHFLGVLRSHAVQMFVKVTLLRTNGTLRNGQADSGCAMHRGTVPQHVMAVHLHIVAASTCMTQPCCADLTVHSNTSISSLITCSLPVFATNLPRQAKFAAHSVHVSMFQGHLHTTFSVPGHFVAAAEKALEPLPSCFLHIVVLNFQSPGQLYL